VRVRGRSRGDEVRGQRLISLLVPPPCRYYEGGTPGSSLSPASPSALDSPSPAPFPLNPHHPTTADFSEFLGLGAAFENNFANLTLSEREQRELYEAAKVIQKAYRSYKGRQKAEEEEKEKAAAVLIRKCPRDPFKGPLQGPLSPLFSLSLQRTTTGGTRSTPTCGRSRRPPS
jgi:hypothetical protein